MEELGKVSGAMTSQIKGSVGDWMALCTITYCIVQLRVDAASPVKYEDSDTYFTPEWKDSDTLLKSVGATSHC